MDEAEKRARLAAKWTKKRKAPAMPVTELGADAPAPHLARVIETRGAGLTTLALQAWAKRLAGEPIVDVAHSLGLSIAAAKTLIAEAHEAIAEDLKTALNQNRELDLQRTDMILRSFLPGARAGIKDDALVVLKALSHRSRLTGTEPQAQPVGAKAENVLIWIQNQLPAINKIVDSLPIELER